MSKRTSLLLILVAVSACASAPIPPRSALSALHTNMAAEEVKLREAETRATHLSARWDDVSAAYDRAKSDFFAAGAAFRETSSARVSEKAILDEARTTFEIAQRRWVWVSYLIEAAAAVDAANMSRAAAKGRATTDSNAVMGCPRRHFVRCSGVRDST